MRHLLSILLLLSCLNPGVVAAKPVSVSRPSDKMPRLFVLSVGVNTYEDTFFPPLKWAENDAERFAREIGRDNGYEVKRVVLKGSQVSTTTMRESLDEIARTATSKDVLLIYLSAHGSLKVGGSGDLEPVIVLSNTVSGQLASSSLAHKTLLRWMGSVSARKKILITASCHSGVGKSRLTPDISRLLSQNKGVPDLARVSEGTLILSAAAKNEVALEDDKYKSDLYTHFFIDALSLYDRNQDGAVSILEAHDYATEMAFKKSKGRQRPTIQTEAIGDIDIPLRGRRNKKALPILQGYDTQFAGMEVEVNHQEKGRLPFAFPLQTGKNDIALYSQDREEKIGEFTVRAREGDTLSVEDLMKGHPFSVGPYVGQMRAVGRAYRRLLDERPLSVFGAVGVWRVDRFELGLHLQAPVHYGSAILDGLFSDAREQMTSVSAGFRLIQTRMFAGSLHAVSGQDQMKLSISDETTGYSESVGSSAVIVGGRMSLFWNPIDLLVITLDGEYQKLKHDFDRLGSVDASRRIVYLGLRYTFGGKARRR